MSSHFVCGHSGSSVRSRVRFLLRPDRLPRLLLLPGVVDIVMRDGTGVFEAELVAVSEEGAEAATLEGVF